MRITTKSCYDGRKRGVRVLPGEERYEGLLLAIFLSFGTAWLLVVVRVTHCSVLRGSADEVAAKAPESVSQWLRSRHAIFGMAAFAHQGEGVCLPI
jgi:hypothetical protein